MTSRARGRYKVTAAGGVTIHAGILGLSPSQADARMHRLTALSPRACRAQTRNASKQRHAKDNEAREKVLRDLKKNPSRFRSAAEAGRHYVELLAEQGHPLKFRTVRDWILDSGIKLK